MNTPDQPTPDQPTPDGPASAHSASQAPIPAGGPAPMTPPPGQAVPSSSTPGARRNTVALIALVVAVLGFVFALVKGAMIVGWILLPVAFILAIVGLLQHGRPKGMAVAALVVSVVGTIVGVVAFAGALGGAVDDALGQSTSSTSTAGSDAQSTPAQSETGAGAGNPATASPASTPQPFNAGGLLSGTATPTFPAGDAGKVGVVQVGALLKDRGTLLFAFRNNTDAAISHVDWTATARSGGTIVASGSSQGTTPVQVQPGEVGLSYIYFDNAASIPDDATYDFQVSTSPADTSFYNTAPLKVSEANLNGGSITGGAVNDTGAKTAGPFSVAVYCFDGDKLVDQTTGFSDQDAAAPGAAVSFSVPLYGTQCPSFVVGVGGYFE